MDPSVPARWREFFRQGIEARGVRRLRTSNVASVRRRAALLSRSAWCPWCPWEVGVFPFLFVLLGKRKDDLGLGLSSPVP